MRYHYTQKKDDQEIVIFNCDKPDERIQLLNDIYKIVVVLQENDVVFPGMLGAYMTHASRVENLEIIVDNGSLVSVQCLGALHSALPSELFSFTLTLNRTCNPDELSTLLNVAVGKLHKTCSVEINLGAPWFDTFEPLLMLPIQLHVLEPCASISVAPDDICDEIFDETFPIDCLKPFLTQVSAMDYEACFRLSLPEMSVDNETFSELQHQCNEMLVQLSGPQRERLPVRRACLLEAFVPEALVSGAAT